LEKKNRARLEIEKKILEEQQLKELSEV